MDEMRVEVELPGTSFDANKFNAVWRSLNPRTKDKIRAKAQWERVTLSAAMRGWWPKLWQKVAYPDTRNPALDPQPGDKVPHRDGGTVYVLYRTPKMVAITRRPDGDVFFRWHRWIRLSTFQREAVGGGAFLPPVGIAALGRWLLKRRVWGVDNV